MCEYIYIYIYTHSIRIFVRRCVRSWCKTRPKQQLHWLRRERWKLQPPTMARQWTRSVTASGNLVTLACAVARGRECLAPNGRLS